MIVDCPYEDFIRIVLGAAANAQHRYTGTLTRDPVTGNVTSFTRTRFPRNKYGPPPTVKECEAGISYLAGLCRTEAVKESHSPGTSRVVLGLYEGQHASGWRDQPDGPDYSVQEVGLRLGIGFSVSSAEVLNVRLAPDGTTSHYSEQLAEIIFPTTGKQRVYDLADAMKQERFSVEDFHKQGGRSYMVETRWCREPDPRTV